MSSAPMPFVILSGLSGAGKTQAIDAFEDAGYFCVDNLPPQLLSPLVDLVRIEGSKVRRVAVVCDVRGGEYFAEIERVLGPLPTLRGRGRIAAGDHGIVG